MRKLIVFLKNGRYSELSGGSKDEDKFSCSKSRLYMGLDYVWRLLLIREKIHNLSIL